MGAVILALLIVFGPGLWVVDRPGPVDDRLQAREFGNLLKEGHWDGDPGSPVIAIVFHDYRCGPSREFDHVLRRLRARYPEHLAVLYKPLLLDFDPYGSAPRLPHGVACAAEQGQFLSYHRSAIDNPQLVANARGPEQVAEAAGVPVRQSFDGCMLSRRYMEGLEHIHYTQASRIPVRGTPTTILNGRLIEGLVAFEPLDSLVAAELGREGSGGTDQ